MKYCFEQKNGKKSKDYDFFLFQGKPRSIRDNLRAIKNAIEINNQDFIKTDIWLIMKLN